MSINRVESYKGFENAFGFSNEGGVAKSGFPTYADEYIDGNDTNSSIGRREGFSAFGNGIVIARADAEPKEPAEPKPPKEPKETECRTKSEVDRVHVKISPTDPSIEIEYKITTCPEKQDD